MKRSFRMITLKQILSQICPGDWFMSLDLKDAYFHIQVAPLQTILEIHIRRGGHINTRSCRLGWSLAPCTFTQCMDAALSPLRDWWNPHTQLPRRRGSFWPSHGPCLEASLHAGRTTFLCEPQNNLRSLKATYVPGKMNQGGRYVVEDQCLFRGMDAPPAHGSDKLGGLCQSYSSCWKQPRSRSPWDGTSSLKWTARCVIHSLSYGPCMCGRSTEAFRPPRVCPRHYGRS